MRIGAWVGAAGLALAATASLAEPAQLAGDELRHTISGKTVYLNISGFELPINYAANGRMSGKMSTVAASSRAAMAPRTAANGGWQTTSFASNGRVGWTARPIAIG